ncbi:MAG: hypothetical protein WDN02_15235 [Methylovirgula sp.]|uniref:hypothetical protein n=1 Tax=Methylovirgula sp. TaxID=1978224 RepID=UPI0030761453
MTATLRMLLAITMIVASLSARAADGCSGSAFFPEQHPIYELTLLAQKSNTPHATTADLSIFGTSAGRRLYRARYSAGAQEQYWRKRRRRIPQSA